MQQTIYYRFPDGSVTARTVESSGDISVNPEPPQGAIPISAAVYASLVSELDAATDQLVVTLRSAEEQRSAEDYEALIAVGIPELTARRLSGYRALDGAAS
jgi:hypothetical protein